MLKQQPFVAASRVKLSTPPTKTYHKRTHITLKDALLSAYAAAIPANPPPMTMAEGDPALCPSAFK